MQQQKYVLFLACHCHTWMVFQKLIVQVNIERQAAHEPQKKEKAKTTGRINQHCL